MILGLGIGANNTANVCGVVYGTKSMSFRKINVILFITRVIGTFIMSFQLYKLKPESAMGGTCLEFNGTKIELMEKGIVIIAGSTVWLMMCTVIGIPVSASYSIIGAELGYHVQKKGISNTNWTYFTKQFIFLGTFVLIFFTLLTTVLAYQLFNWMVTRLKKITSENRGFRWWTSHMLEICVLSTMFVYITYTPSALINFDKKPMYSILSPVFRIALGLLMFYVWKRSRKSLMGTDSFSSQIVKTLKKCFMLKRATFCMCSWKHNCDDFKTMDSNIQVEEPGNTAPVSDQGNSLNCCVCNIYISMNKYSLYRSLFKQTSTEPNCNQPTQDDVGDDNPETEIHVNIRQENTESEVLRARWFTRLTQTVVIFSCVAYGGHDVSNSVGYIFVMMKLGNLSKLLDICDERISIIVLLLGFCVISLGVWLFGKIVLKTVADLVSLNPIGGFCVEMSAVFTIFTYSHLFNVPVSITYCKVIAMAAVGLVDKTLNWSLFRKILLYWFLTIPATAVISGFFYAVTF